VRDQVSHPCKKSGFMDLYQISKSQQSWTSAPVYVWRKVTRCLWINDFNTYTKTAIAEGRKRVTNPEDKYFKIHCVLQKVLTVTQLYFCYRKYLQ
jgi:hypothetical protein